LKLFVGSENVCTAWTTQRHEAAQGTVIDGLAIVLNLGFSLIAVAHSSTREQFSGSPIGAERAAKDEHGLFRHLLRREAQLADPLMSRSRLPLRMADEAPQIEIGSVFSARTIW